VAVRALVDTWRWAGVPFFLRTGKHMPKRVTEIALQFKSPPLLLFGRDSGAVPEPNVLALHIQPDEGITLKFGSKVPGPTSRVHPVHMDFRYSTRPALAHRAELLLDCLGCSTLFTRDDGVEAAWRFVRHRAALDDSGPWAACGDAGSWGPEAAGVGRSWPRVAPAMSTGGTDVATSREWTKTAGTGGLPQGSQGADARLGVVTRLETPVTGAAGAVASCGSASSIWSSTPPANTADLVSGVIPRLTQRHPARAIVLELPDAVGPARPAAAAITPPPSTRATPPTPDSNHLDAWVTACYHSRRGRHVCGAGHCASTRWGGATCMPPRCRCLFPPAYRLVVARAA
jgi:hypothetical protein